MLTAAGDQIGHHAPPARDDNGAMTFAHQLGGNFQRTAFHAACL
jgi:hypothetical protein